jgi:hypothetical protein
MNCSKAVVRHRFGVSPSRLLVIGDIDTGLSEADATFRFRRPQPLVDLGERVRDLAEILLVDGSISCPRYGSSERPR